MFERFYRATGVARRLVLAASCLAILAATDASACDPVTYCSVIRICSQAPAPWGAAIKEATKVDDPNVLIEKTDDCVQRSNFQGVGRYAKDWNRISDCGQNPERYLNFAHAAQRNACAAAR